MGDLCSCIRDDFEFPVDHEIVDAPQPAIKAPCGDAVQDFANEDAVEDISNEAAVHDISKEDAVEDNSNPDTVEDISNENAVYDIANEDTVQDICKKEDAASEPLTLENACSLDRIDWASRPQEKKHWLVWVGKVKYQKYFIWLFLPMRIL
ncbi:uncharacterized protein LOC129023718 [Pongo pygmaeus]|uniref:uncharacterized protein LOC129023718 n=1 Tax=Pongo pygmaeus TaxID=9600 RepID=UPI0023E13024|nr:uncharacterized protein LOC129023718 [Pongo pygmaeus]